MSYPLYIGCACDRAFVDLTCTMLSSLEDNGDIPEATVIVADFGLSALDRDLLRGSAGRLGARMRFVALAPESSYFPVLPSFSFPLPMLGRFVVPKVITEPYARLVVLDADMVVNSSLRPLFESNMRGFAVGAIRDPLSEPELIARGRKLDPSYLNSGLLLINVDEWNEQGLGDAAMRRLASYSEPPIWPDQDALNDVVGNDWLRLNRKWNLFYAGEPQQFTPEEYRAASIVHFAGAKPTHAWDHPAIALYRHHHERFVAKTFHAKSDHEVRVDWDFIATAYEVFLGRDLETLQVVADRGHWSALAVLKSVINCFECDTTVLEPIRKKRHFQAGRHRGAPSIRQKLWAADRLPLLDATAKRVRDAEGWRDMLEALFGDERLMEWCGLGPVLPDETPEPQALPEPQAALDTASETAPRLEPEGVLNA